ncbi:MAG TPA: lipid-A-disaccharide synthase, partial [Thermoanaerobaculia bacterium]|nr:lipid-A-disaccharide synthase [Thermoanaerobaculia bacterium]
EQLVGVGRPQRRDDRLRIALMPGSRRHEVGDLLPPMLQAIDILRKERDVEAYVILAPTIEHDEIESIMRKTGISVPILPHDRGEALAAADVALSSSGTATLESAVLGTPVVVMYLLSRITYWLARRLVKVPHFSLVNIVAGKNVVPELIQSEVNGARIAQEVRTIMEPANYARLREELAIVRERLGEAGASQRAAEEIYGIMTA